MCRKVVRVHRDLDDARHSGVRKGRGQRLAEVLESLDVIAARAIQPGQPVETGICEQRADDPFPEARPLPLPVAPRGRSEHRDRVDR